MSEGLLRYVMMADAVGIDMGLALVVGALASQAWVWRSGSDWAHRVATEALATRRIGFLLTLVAVVANLWLEAAAMTELPLTRAGAAVGQLLRDTHFGRAWVIGFVAWMWLGALSGLRAEVAHRARLRRYVLACACVGIFAATRSVVSHAGSQGDLSVDVAVDWLHLVLAALWVGIVFTGARIVLPSFAAPATERQAAERWVQKLSLAATVALVGIVASGIFKAWRALPSVDDLLRSDYGLTLTCKVALVAVAVGLGGINRFGVLPGYFSSLRSHRDGGPDWRVRLVTIIRIEAVTLALVLVEAVALSNTEPPGTT